MLSCFTISSLFQMKLYGPMLSSLSSSSSNVSRSSSQLSLRRMTPKHHTTMLQKAASFHLPLGKFIPHPCSSMSSCHNVLQSSSQPSLRQRMPKHYAANGCLISDKQTNNQAIIICDSSHQNQPVVISFMFLFS